MPRELEVREEELVLLLFEEVVVRVPEERLLEVEVRVLEDLVSEERVSLVVPELREVLVPRDSTVERVGVVPVLRLPLLSVEVLVVAPVLRLPLLSEEVLVVAPVLRLPLLSEEVLVVAPVLRLPLLSEEVLVVAPVLRLPLLSEEVLVVEEVPEEWLLRTCVPVEGLWSRVISAVLIVGLLLPGVQVLVGMGAGALGWRM